MRSKSALIDMTPNGLYCAAGDFYIDPHGAQCARAVITHAHADHARSGAVAYHASTTSTPLLDYRLDTRAHVTGHPWGEPFQLGDTRISLHPAGHVLGSAQVRVENDEEVWVVTGDYKRDADPSCEAFEPIRCDTLLSEATFALPVYRWQPTRQVVEEIFDWWQGSRENHETSVLFCYALGKAQRILAELRAFSKRPVYLHGAVAPLVDLYRAAGIDMVPTRKIDLREQRDYRGELVLAPPGAAGSTWMRRFKNAQTGFCSGWMRIRGNRRRRGYDRGFVLSDHADWPSLLQTFEDSGAQRILLHHGHAESLVRYLRERGIDAAELSPPHHEAGPQ